MPAMTKEKFKTEVLPVVHGLWPRYTSTSELNNVLYHKLCGFFAEAVIDELRAFRGRNLDDPGNKHASPNWRLILQDLSGSSEQARRGPSVTDKTVNELRELHISWGFDTPSTGDLYRAARGEIRLPLQRHMIREFHDLADKVGANISRRAAELSERTQT